MIEGWMGKKSRRWLDQQARIYRRIVEVGVWKGKSTKILASHGATVWVVDHWQGTPLDPEQHALYPDAGDTAFADFCRNLADEIRDETVRIVRMSSLEAAAECADEGHTFDLVFIDGDHSYESVRADIAAWLPLVEPGGLLSGHDYKPKWPGVVRAVDEAFNGRARHGPASIWSVRI